MALSQPDQGVAGAPAASSNPSEAPTEELIGGLTADEVVSQFNSRFKHSKSHFDEWRTEARLLYDMNAGRQWDPQDEARLKEELRPMVTFNIAGKYMDVMTGLQINNRQDIRFYPREQGDVRVNELMTGSVSWGRDLCDAEDEETDAFYDAALTGIGWCEGYLDTDLEVSGAPAVSRVDPLEMFPDPGARKKNFNDGRFNIRIRFVDDDEYEELMGEEASDGPDEIDVEFDVDDGIELIEEPQDYDKSPGSSSSAPKAKKRAIADYQWWKKEVRYLATAPGTGQREMTEAEFQAYQRFFEMAKQRGAPMQVQKIRRKAYYRAFISKGKVGKGGLSPYQQGFTYHAITGKRDRNKNTWYGIGRSILEPQRWLNSFFSTILYCIMTNAKGGIMAEKDAFDDPRKAESEWADPSAIAWLKKGALSGAPGVNSKIQPKPPAVYPQGLDRLMDFTMNSLPQVTGMPVELMGLSDRQQPGVLEAQRKQSAMSIIAWAFDGMRRYYKSMGKQLARYVIDYVPEGTLVMVNGENSRQYVPLLKSTLGTTFDCVVDEAPTSTNQQERTWLALQGLIPMALQAGQPIPPSILKYAPIPEDLINEWMQLLQGDPKKQQVTEQQAMQLMEKTSSEISKNQSQSRLNDANAQKAMATANESGASAQLKTAQAFEHAAHAGAAQAQTN